MATPTGAPTPAWAPYNPYTPSWAPGYQAPPLPVASQTQGPRPALGSDTSFTPRPLSPGEQSNLMANTARPAQTPFTPGLQAALGQAGAAYTAANPAQEAAATLNPNQQYVDEFNASLARQRGAIDSALAAALGSMGHRRDLAAQTITKGSADVKQALDNQQAFNTTAAANADKGLIAGAAPGAGANDNLYSQVINSAKSTETGAEPLLQLGAQANYDSGAAQLQANAIAARSAVDQQAQQFAMQQQQQQWQADQQQQQDRLKLAEAGYSKAQIDHALIHGGGLPPAPGGGSGTPDWYTQQQIKAALSGQAHAANAEDTRVQKASGNSFATAADLANFAKTNPEYGWAERALGKKPGQPNGKYGPTLNSDQVVGHVQSEQVIAALFANGLISSEQAKAWRTVHDTLASNAAGVS